MVHSENGEKKAYKGVTSQCGFLNWYVLKEGATGGCASKKS